MQTGKGWLAHRTKVGKCDCHSQATVDRCAVVITIMRYLAFSGKVGAVGKLRGAAAVVGGY